MLFRRLRGDAVLTRDPILRAHRFTNAYRAADRVTQFLISEVVGKTEREDDLVFRVLLFKTFNRIETWRALERAIGTVTWREFNSHAYVSALTSVRDGGEPIYSNAYMMPNPPLGQAMKHENHLALLERIMRDGTCLRILAAKNLEGLYRILLDVPSFGRFLAFQYAIDLNYSDYFSFPESQFVVAGPGALSGIRKCFSDADDLEPTDVIRVMSELAEREFQRLGLRFPSLWGRPLQLIDCQNLFCEVDKYARVAHPELDGGAGRTRIKQRYAISKGPLPEFVFPRRWELSPTLSFGNVSRITI
jgi:hypothetical protein